MGILDLFPHIRIINLPQRQDRRDEMLAELLGAGIAPLPDRVEFFPAFRPTSEEAQGWPSVGARGCFQSHLAILKLARERGWPRVLVMEDDLCIDPRFTRDADGLVQQLEAQSWAFAYFGHQVELEETGEPVRLQPWTEPVVTSHFYGFDGAFYDPLIEFLEAAQRRAPGHPDGGPMHVDGAFNMFRARHPEARALLAVPNLGTQRSSASDVTTRWIDGTPGVRELAQSARKVRRWLQRT